MRRVAVLLGPKPKVPRKGVLGILTRFGFVPDEHDPDFGLVIGGDGLFSYFGRTANYPLLFAGFRGTHPTGSRANLAQVEYRHLHNALRKISQGQFIVEEYPLLSVSLDTKEVGVAFTDTYVERGLEPGCLRYEVHVETPSESFTDFAVANGVVVSTAAGSTGYFSYPDKLLGTNEMVVDTHTKIQKDRLGICHILPTYTLRMETKTHPLRYTVPMGSKIMISLRRRAQARLYGVGRALRGYPFSWGQTVKISVAGRKARLVSLKG